MTQQVNSNRNSSPKLRTIAKAVVIASVVGGISMPVAAKKYRDYRESNRTTVDYAKVVDVAPIVESYQVNNPVEQCWDEKVPVRYSRHSERRDYRGRHKSPTGEILGAIIGGAIGNQFGSGRGKKVATAAGAVLGASVAHDVKHAKRDKYRHGSRGYDRNRYEVVQRCEVRDSYTTEEQVVGYNVAYKYRGNVYHTEMNQHPGDKIKVRVTVDPV